MNKADHTEEPARSAGSLCTYHGTLRKKNSQGSRTLAGQGAAAPVTFILQADGKGKATADHSFLYVKTNIAVRTQCNYMPFQPIMQVFSGLGCVYSVLFPNKKEHIMKIIPRNMKK